MVTKGLLLCAGMGSRLRPITYTTAKHVLPVANKPLIHYTIEMLKAAGVTSVGIIVGANRDQLEGVVGDGSLWGVRVDYIVQDDPRGTAHAVGLAQEWAGDDPFIMVLGDIMVENGVGALLDQYHRDQPDAMLVLNRTDRPRQFGIAEIADGHIVGLEEKPEHPKSDLAVAGIYIFGPSIFAAIETVQPSPRGELELPDAIRTLITDGGRVDPCALVGWWKDTGRPEDIIDLNRLLLDGLSDSAVEGTVDSESSLTGNVVLDRTATVERSVIHGPVVIGPGAVVRDAFVGPHTSLDTNVTIEAAEIESSVVMEGSVIQGLPRRIASSLIGKNVRLIHDGAALDAHRLVVGDDSQVSLV